MFEFSKEVVELPPVIGGKGARPLMEALSSAELSFKIRCNLQLLQPTLLNRYTRRYYISTDHRFRVTLDREISYFGMRGLDRTPTAPVPAMSGTVLEAKYPVAEDKSARMMLNSFPFRLSKHSKYALGIKYLRAHGLLSG